MHWSTLILIAAALAGCSPADDAPADAAPAEAGPIVASVAQDYKHLKLITPKPVYVNPELALLCRGASQEEVETARKQHGVHANAAISIYMNEVAARAFATPGKPYPVGAVVIKEKRYGGYLTTNDEWVVGGKGVGGMIKRPPGFDSEHGDWEYFYFEDPKKIESGRIASCVQCHAAASGTDRVFGTWAKAHEAKR
ncbi:MAG TPA: cytochrome P460 family protein [Tepidisphaeraceae bacterium]